MPYKKIIPVFLAEVRYLRTYDAQCWTLFISRLIVVGSFSLSMLFFSIYLYQDLHVSLKAVGGIMMIAAAFSAVATMIGGNLADRIGRRHLLWITIAVRTVVFVAIAYVMVTRPDVVSLTALYIIARVMGSIYLPASDAMLADIVELQHRSRAYGVMRIFANAGFTIGPAVGGWVAEYSIAWCFLLSAGASLLASVFSFIFIKETFIAGKSKHASYAEMFRFQIDIRLLLFCSISLIFFLLMGQFGLTFSLFATENVGISKAELGKLFMTNGLMVILLQYPVTLFVENLPHMKKLLLGMTIYTAGFILFGPAHSFAFLTLGVILFTLGEMIYEPSASTVVANMAPVDARGSYIGIFGVSRSIGWSIAPFIGGILMDSYLQQGMVLWGIIGLFGVIAIAGCLVLDKTIFRSF